MGLRVARKKSDVEAERAAKAAQQASKAWARETRERVRSVATGREASQTRLPMPESLITKEKPSCYSDPVGPARFTPARFLSSCCEESAATISKAWKRGDQLVSRRVPVDALPCVVIMASYLRTYDVELVDDFDKLIERYDDHISEVFHPDKFLASCISILHKRYQAPSAEAFESIHIHDVYEAMF